MQSELKKVRAESAEKVKELRADSDEKLAVLLLSRRRKRCRPNPLMLQGGTAKFHARFPCPPVATSAEEAPESTRETSWMHHCRKQLS